MEEKERYELLNDNFIYDNKLKEYVSSPNSSMKHYMETLTELLNQQNKQLEYYKKEMLRDGETFTMSQAKCFDEIIQENKQLKQQLHSLPKKIVEDIKTSVLTNQKDKNGWISVDVDLQYLFDEVLDEILKKYRGEK